MTSIAEILGILAALGFSWARMSIALLLSILFSLAVGILAGVNRTAEKILIPLLDVLQSIPILSFFPLALYAFIALHPVIGPEIAAIFLIFTSQVWNIAFGVYESVKLIPKEILEAAKSLGFGWGRKLRSLYLPAAFPKIASNLPASWANGLYFLVACEIITIGEARWKLFGIGTLSTEFILSGRVLEFAISLGAVMLAVVLMNLLLFIPLMRLGERYKFQETAAEVPRVWIERVTKPLGGFGKIFSPRLKFPKTRFAERFSKHLSKYAKPIATAFLILVLLACVYEIASITSFDGFTALVRGFEKLGVIAPLVMIAFSLMRVAAAIVIALIWVIPTAVLIYEKSFLEKILIPFFQVLASLPATILLPLIVKIVLDLKLPSEIGAIILILLGTQWYLLFFITGAMKSIPREEEELCKILRIEGLSKFKHLYFPRMLPSLIMGCLVAMGGGWNTLVVAERIVLDHFIWQVENPGIGKALSEAVSMGDIGLLTAATIWMAGFIVIFNRLVWRRLYEKAIQTIGATA